MATTMRKSTIDKQYQMFLGLVNKAREQKNIKSIIVGGKSFEVKMSREDFEEELRDFLKDVDPTSPQKYKAFETIFETHMAQYTKKQMNHFRREVGKELENLRFGNAAHD